MGETDLSNGFCNRYLWIAVKRSKMLPEGGSEIDLAPLSCQLAEYLYRFRGIFCWKGRDFQGEGGDATTSGGIMAG